MIPVPLARALSDAGLVWTPSSGDQFVVRDRDMDDQVFVLSDMTVELRPFGTGTVLAFNGSRISVSRSTAPSGACSPCGSR